MANISDYLRDFEIRPKGLKTEGRKSEFYLTLSAVLKFQNELSTLNKIDKLQKEITNLIGNDLETLDNPYKDGLYIYKKDTLHFSLINFFTSKSDWSYNNLTDFSLHQKKLNKDQRYQKLKNIIQTNTPKKISYTADVRWLFTGLEKDGYKIGSLALQVYPEQLFIKKISEIKVLCKEKLESAGVNNDEVKIKGYPNETEFFRFVINIARFIQVKNFDEIINTKVVNYVEKFNRDCDEKRFSPLRIKKLSIVESDPWLFNYHCKE